MQLRELLYVTSEDVFGKIYYKQDEMYEGFLEYVFDLSEEDGRWVLDTDVFSVEVMCNKLYVYTR